MVLHPFNPAQYGFYPPLVSDYLQQATGLRPFYAHPPGIHGIQQAVEARQFSAEKREILAAELTRQYEGIDITDAVSENIRLLARQNTFTITTGHQLGIATGPLFTLYKVMTTISLCRQMKDAEPAKHFVPVFWLAAEDHDLAEIQHLQLFGKTYTWNTAQTGAVGRMNCEGLPDLMQQLEDLFANDPTATSLCRTMAASYTAPTLSAATRRLFHHLFGRYGLLILDADAAPLKQQFTQVIKDDVLNQRFEPLIRQQTARLEAAGYKAQVNPRPVNFFMLEGNQRHRITTDPEYNTARTSDAIDSNPGMYSPNVCMRPLYQECVLPNVCYVGGPGEIAYWLQLKDAFDAASIQIPVLWLRHSVAILSPAKASQVQTLGLMAEHFLDEEKEVVKKYLSMQTGVLSFEQDQQAVIEAIDQIKLKALSNDKTLQPQADMLQKAVNEALNHFTKKAEKSHQQKHEQALAKISRIHSELYPGGQAQERVANLLAYASLPIEQLIDAFHQQPHQGYLLCLKG